MTDKELLEMAAKAAGIVGIDASDVGLKIRGILGLWNPLTDDGDALRLAVKLGIELGINDSEHYVYAFKRNLDTSKSEATHGDPYAATRRAVVRAVAEIGKTL